MPDKRIKRFANLKVCMTEQEYEKIKEGYAASTCRSLSEYIRKLLFRKRITVTYRNRAYDEFIEESIRLRKALAQFCGQGGSDELQRAKLVREMEDIKSIIIKIAETCSPK